MDQDGARTTRWWWVRHAPVTSEDGRIYGAGDPPADISDGESFRGLARLLPRDAVWVTSHLRRTHQTMAAIGEAGYPLPKAGGRGVEIDLGEQSFGDLQGRSRREVFATVAFQRHRFWLTAPEIAPPGGESFQDLLGRVTPVVERLTHEHARRDVVCVAHGGTIRAALAHALAIPAAKALHFQIDNLSITRIDHHPAEENWPDPAWQVVMVNRRPR